MSLPTWLERPPSKIVCVAVNYRSHLLGRPMPERPELFFKPPSSIISAGEAIVFPPDARHIEAEGEIAVVIGKSARDIAPGQALGIVRGYACAFDVSEREWQKGDRQWWRAKGSDTFCPLGPDLSPELAHGARLETRLNGEIAQDGTSDEMIFGIPEVLSFASRFLTWEPGDILLTGTPARPPRLAPGDVVEVSIAAIGSLWCPVA